MKNDTTISAFYPLVRVGLWGKAGANLNADLDYNEKIEWGKVILLAQEQSVQGLLLQGIEWLKNHNDNNTFNFDVPQLTLLQWIGEVQMIEQRNREMNAFIADFIEKLRKENIHPILVKGQGIAQCYENPVRRICGDVDFFLDDGDYDKAKRFLVPMATKVELEYKGSKHLGMSIDGWSVELHGSLRVGLPKRINRVLDDIQVDTLKGGNVRSWMNGETQICMLGTENDIVYVFVHFLNHFYKGGIGLRQICDWCRLLYTYRESLNIGLLESRVKRAGLMSEWKAFGAFSVNFLGMPVEAMPFLNIEECTNLKKKADRICSFIMEVGNFGHNRDTSYYGKYPFVVRKAISACRRTKDLFRHTMIFPLDSLRFFPYILWNGLRSAARGE